VERMGNSGIHEVVISAKLSTQDNAKGVLSIRWVPDRKLQPQEQRRGMKALSSVLADARFAQVECVCGGGSLNG
jgi:hypothetical protein